MMDMVVHVAIQATIIDETITCAIGTLVTDATLKMAKWWTIPEER